MKCISAFALAALWLAAGLDCSPVGNNTASTSCLPVVDLGYELHQALSYNSTTDTYKFSNIRFAKAPTGDLRFRAPVAPDTNRATIQNGSEIRFCPQGVPVWQAKALGPVAEYTAGKPFTLQSWEDDIANATAPPSGSIPVTEDCLFLDVHVPRKVFIEAAKDPNGFKGVPVLFWIFGGGYVLGAKAGFGSHDYNPAGFFETAKELNKGDLIYVATNYRLGGLGFLAGPEVQKDGDANVGLLDQRFALDWVQKYIHLFGGSPNHVTIMGESAGAGSVFQQIAAYGGAHGSVPFSQAILQSPAVVPSGKQPSSTYQDFLAVLNVTSLQEARNLSSGAIIAANAQYIGSQPLNAYGFFPVQDGTFMPDIPYRAIQDHAFDTSVRVLTAHNSLEGSFFFDPTVKTEDDFKRWIVISLPGLSVNAASYLADHLYPPVFDGSLGYVDQDSRQMKLWGEAAIDCTFQLFNEAFGGDSHAYEFSVSPGLHTQDLTYTFDEATPAFFPTAQKLLQQIIVNFVVTGKPSGQAASVPLWGSEKKLLNITGSGAVVASSSVNATRCAWWQAGNF